MCYVFIGKWERANLVVSTGQFFHIMYICDSHCTYHNVIPTSNFACALLETGLVVEVMLSLSLQYSNALPGGTSTEDTTPLLTTVLMGGSVSLQRHPKSEKHAAMLQR